MNRSRRFNAMAAILLIATSVIALSTYGGTYELGSRHGFAVGPLVSTEMAGPEPAMRAKSAYLTLLRQARSYRVDAGRLTLFEGDGNESLIFAAVGR